MRLSVVAATLALAATHAAADSLTGDVPSARSIGRAGVGTASDDGIGALLTNPAGLARRDTTRLQLATIVSDDATSWRPDLHDQPTSRDQSASSVLPAAAAEFSLSDFIFGVSAQTVTASSRTFASPLDIPADVSSNLYESRYAGIASSLRRDAITLGVARRFGDAVAVGLSVSGSRTSLDESRSVWADPIPGRAPDRNHDLVVALSGAGYSPSALAGILVAPPDTRIELAGSIGYSAATTLTGGLAATQPSPAMTSPGLTVDTSSPSSRLTLHQPVAARTAARWVDTHWIAEVDMDLFVYAATAQQATWDVTNTTISASTTSAALSRVPSRLSAQTHGAVRAAVDVELVAGFLWVTAGYAYANPGTAASRLSPTLANLGGHTAAAGLEISSGDFTISLGWARTWSIAREVASPAWQHDNPFTSASDSPLPGGSYDGSRDLVGISIDAEFGSQ